MGRPNFSLPHERNKAKLKSEVLRDRVKVAELKQRLAAKQAELRAMQPKKREG
jgi:hypothetical protein